jgi:MarR family transcriptional regulator, 2-MHQ and catechol-resistance regulon repressor
MANSCRDNYTHDNYSLVNYAYNGCVPRHTAEQYDAAGTPDTDTPDTDPTGTHTSDTYDDERITAMGLLAEVVTGLNARVAAQLATHQLSPAEFEVLLRLGRTPGGSLRMSDLAAQTQLTTSGITRVVDRMERDGLIMRRACPTDRRGLFAEITAVGRARLDEVLPGHVDLIDTWLTGQLTAEQLDGLLRGLRIVRDAVRPEATAGAEP